MDHPPLQLTQIERSAMLICGLTLLLNALHVSGQVQSFRIAPEDVSAIQGGTVQIRCVIDNLGGSVQWAKDGFVLGTDRSIPGFDNYQVVGNEALGEYDLLITEVSLSDDAEFQCQVGPADGHSALIGRAKLNVLIPPESPLIEGHTNGSTVSVAHGVESLNLTCIALNGKPAATITWSKGETEITEGITYTTAQGTHVKLENARSMLSFKPEDTDDTLPFKCVAKNEARVKAAETIVILSVLHPPGQPEITGYTNGQVVKTGDTLKLKCISKGGNPLANVYWFKNEVELDYSFAIAGNTVENELVFEVKPNDMNAVYRCKVSNKVTPTPLVAEVTLTVQFAPTSVNITGHESAKAGETIKLKCVTDMSNPRAEIAWFALGQSIEGATSKYKESPLGGYITTSEISVTLTDREDKVTYQCHATNKALGKTVIESVILEVMYPPGQPEIFGYTEGRTVTAEQIQTMSCTSKGGNPVAKLTWWKGNKEIKGQIVNAFNMVTSQISFILKPDDNRAEYRCNATNEATETPLISTVTLHVNFPPTSLTITTNPPQIKVGQKVSITCQSSSSNPASELTWWKDDTEIPATSTREEDAAHDGKSTISTLDLIPTVADHQEIYACKASNVLIERAVSDAVTLDVLFKPTFPVEVPQKTDILEYTSILLNFTAYGNPTDIKYNWFKGTQKVKFGKKRRKRDVSLPNITKDKGVLEIKNISRAEAGIYTLKTKNSEGETVMNFDLNVQYGGSVKSITDLKTVDQGVNVTLECVVDANPQPEGAITWSRPDYDMARTVTVTEGTKSSFTIVGAVKGDSGLFTCTVNNNIGDPASKEAKLVVKFAPEIDKSPASLKFAADKGATAKLICVANGAPAITFKWKKGDTDLDTSGEKYSEELSKPGLVQHQSVLSVENTEKADYGLYTCVTTNELGEDSSQIKLDGTSRPDPPNDLQFVNSTHNSVTITWTPGFDGGSTQWFQVRYNEIMAEGDTVTKGPYKYEDVMPKDATVFMVERLKLATTYEMTVRGINRLGSSDFAESLLKTSTSAVAPVTDEKTNDVPLYIILTVVVIGMVLLGLNVLLILLFIRRRRLRKEKDSETTSQTNTVEMFNNAPTITEDSKSYTSYGRMSLDDYPDEFYKPFEDEEERRGFMHPSFLPPPGSDGLYPSLNSNGDLYRAPDYRPLPGGGGGGPVFTGVGRRSGIIMDEHTAVASGLGPPSVLDPYDMGSLPSKHRPPNGYTNSLEKSEQSLPSVGYGSTSQLVPPQSRPPPLQMQPQTRPTMVPKNPPAPPARSSSKTSNESPVGKANPPLPSRNYSSEEIPRYAPAPGGPLSNSRPSTLQRPPPPAPPDPRGHLV